jgi:hypothetical protein
MHGDDRLVRKRVPGSGMNTDGTDVFTGPATVNVDICVKIAVELPDKTGGRICFSSPESRSN